MLGTQATGNAGRVNCSPRETQPLVKRSPHEMQEGPSMVGGALLSAQRSTFYIRGVRLRGLPCLVDGDGRLLVEALGLIVPVGSHRPERSFYCTCVVAAEEQLTPGGLEYNADICLGSATIAPVSCV
jgi:hypothetical protein